MDTPILLVNLQGKVSDPKSQFIVNEEAIKVLEGLEAPIGVISVAGLYRTGKSFILNQLAGRTEGFDIGASIQPQTQGIWMWALDRETLRRRRLPDAMNIVLLDTEGLGSFTKTETHDVKIFSLGVLLSSYLIYNSLGTIDDTAVENMSLIVNLTRSIREKVSETDRPGIAPKVDPTSLRAFFPRFLWLLRDFALDLQIDGRAVTEDEYLEHALKPLDGTDAEIVSKNKVRETIRAVFHQRSCFTLKRPVDDEDDLQELGSLKPSQFRKDYLDEVDKLIKLVYRNVAPKTLYNTPLSGAVIASLARQYVTAINGGTVPVIASAWESVLAQKTDAALDAARAAVDAELGSPDQFEDPLDDVLAGSEAAGPRATAAGIGAFVRRAVLAALPPATLESHLRAVTAQAADRAAEVAKAVQDETVRIAAEAAARVARDVQTEVNAAAGVDEIRAAAERGEAAFREAVRGDPDAAMGALHGVGWTGMLLAGAAQVVAAEAARIGREAEERHRAEMDRAQHEHQVLKDLYDSVDKEWQKEQANAKALREEATDLRYEIMGHKKTIQSLESDLAALNEAKSDLGRQLDSGRSERERERAEREEAERRIQEEAAQAAEEERNDMLQELDDRQERIDALSNELDAAYRMVETAKEEAEKALEDERAKVKKEIEAMKAKAEEDAGCHCIIM
ncbi:hypothetical protein H9P43_005904 [Blastocladiella emersonii ATCC 22665]|nr:hypothetical protein H9P43_005904 [Blastocladiella emersonii ATCC 22665]